MSEFTWGIKTPEDLLNKAERELCRFREAHDANSPDQIDHAVNCALTLLSLRDWTFRAAETKLAMIPFPHASGGCPRPAKTAAEFGELVRYLPWRNVPGHTVVFEAIEALANGAKHFELDQKRLRRLDAWTSAEPFAVADHELRGSGWHDSGSSGEITINVSEGSLKDALVVKIGNPATSYSGLGIEKLCDGTLKVRADRLLSDAVVLWRSILEWLSTPHMG